MAVGGGQAGMNGPLEPLSSVIVAFTRITHICKGECKKFNCFGSNIFDLHWTDTMSSIKLLGAHCLPLPNDAASGI